MTNRTAGDIVKMMHAAVEPIFQELAEELIATLNTSDTLTKALEHIDELKAEVAALRKRRPAGGNTD